MDNDFARMLEKEFKDLSDEQIVKLRGQFTGRGRIYRCDCELSRRVSERRTTKGEQDE